MAPCDYQNLAARPANPSQLSNELCLVRHVLPTLHGPYEVKLPIPEGLMQSVCYLIVDLVT